MPPRKSPTVYDVASSAGVSIATVSRVLRSPDKVSSSTRERVLEAVQTLGYVPNASARGLAGRRTGVLGLLIPGHDIPATSTRGPGDGGVEFIDDRDGSHVDPYRNRYFEQLMRGAEAAAWRAGYALLVAAGTSVSRDMVLHDLTGRIDALAVVSRTISDELIEDTAARTPVVVVAGRAPGSGQQADSSGSGSSDGAGSGVRIDSVRADNRGGMRALVRHVLAVKPQGPLLFLDGPPDSPDARGRELGFRDAIAEADGDTPQHRVVRADFSWRGGADAIVEQLRREVPAAVVGANDQSALGALAALREAGVSVPDTCVVTGFDGIDETRYSEPRLTTVRQPMVDLGIHTVQALLRRLETPDAPAQDVQLPVDVLLRTSCGPQS